MHYRYPRHRRRSAAESSAQDCRSGPCCFRRKVPLLPFRRGLLTSLPPLSLPKHRSSFALYCCEKGVRGSAEEAFRSFLSAKKHAPLPPLQHAPLSKVLGVRHRNLGIESQADLSACARAPSSPPRQRSHEDGGERKSRESGSLLPSLSSRVRSWRDFLLTDV